MRAPISIVIPGRIKEEVENFINSELVSYCENGKWIAGRGWQPLQL